MSNTYSNEYQLNFNSNLNFNYAQKSATKISRNEIYKDEDRPFEIYGEGIVK